MMAKNKEEQFIGFTIVELLVVIVIIGILASITMVSYSLITKKAYTAVLQSDLKNASTVLEMDKAKNGSYPATESEANDGKGLPKSDGTEYQYTVQDGNYYLSATSEKNDTIAYYTSSALGGAIADGVWEGHIAPGNASAPSGWKQLAAGFYYTCGVDLNSKAYCWGVNDYGQLGDGSGSNSLSPVAVLATGGFLDDKTIKSIATGERHACALASDNQVYCWGWNNDGQLGDGSDTDSSTPVAVSASGALSGKTVKSIMAGNNFTCAVASDDQVYCWGGLFRTINSSPVLVSNGALSGKTIKSIAAGETHACAIASDDKVYCWGSGMYGELGDGSGVESLVPVAVSTSGVLSGKTIKSIVAGYQITCAIDSDNKAYCWGMNNSDQLGDGVTTADRSLVPVAVSTSGVLSGKTIKSIVAGNSHVCAIASDDQAYCWGNDSAGQLGDGNYDSSSTPVPVSTIGVLSGKTIKTVTAGTYNHTCAIASDDQAYCWGNNYYGELGTGLTDYSAVPVLVVKPLPASSQLAPTYTFKSQELYVAYPGESQTVCKEWTATSGGTIKAFYVSHETERDYDIFTVYADNVEKYSGSGYLYYKYVDLTSSPATTLKACMAADSETQDGHGGEVVSIVQ